MKHTLLLMDPVRYFKGPRARTVRRKSKGEDDPAGCEGARVGRATPQL